MDEIFKIARNKEIDLIFSSNNNNISRHWQLKSQNNSSETYNQQMNFWIRSVRAYHPQNIYNIFDNNHDINNNNNNNFTTFEYDYNFLYAETNTTETTSFTTSTSTATVSTTTILTHDVYSPSSKTLVLANGHLNNYWALLALILVIGTAAGNILVCLAIAWERRLQNVTNYFLMSLAITDLMVAILVMPLGILTLVKGKY